MQIGTILCIENRERASASHARPHSDFRDAHTPVWEPTHRDLVQPHSRIQATTKSVVAPLVRTDTRHIEVLTDLQPVNTLSNFRVLAQLLDSGAEIRVPQRDAMFVAARGIDHLGGRNGTVRMGLAISRSRRFGLSARILPLQSGGKAGFPSVDCINIGVQKADF